MNKLYFPDNLVVLWEINDSWVDLICFVKGEIH